MLIKLRNPFFQNLFKPFCLTVFPSFFRVSISLDVREDGVLNNVIVTPGTPTPEELQAQEQAINMLAPAPMPGIMSKGNISGGVGGGGSNNLMQGQLYSSGPVSTSTTPAVQIRQASKSYVPGKPIIDNLDMTVPRGTM